MKLEYETNFMKEICRKVGQVQLARLTNIHDIIHKGKIDIVTEVDKECEELIVSSIYRTFPSDNILAEEGSSKSSTNNRRWIIDPLDGTVNYAHGFPFFAVSIALEEEGEIAAAVTYDPIRNEMFYAVKGEGAFLNERDIKVSKTDRLIKALLATGFAYNVQEGGVEDNLDNFARFVKNSQAVRRPGSAALDLAYVACGRLDGFWELFLKPWDMAAGYLLVKEAGGIVTDFKGDKFNLYGTQILASNGRLHSQMQEVLSGSG